MACVQISWLHIKQLVTQYTHRKPRCHDMNSAATGVTNSGGKVVSNETLGFQFMISINISINDMWTWETDNEAQTLSLCVIKRISSFPFLIQNLTILWKNDAILNSQQSWILNHLAEIQIVWLVQERRHSIANALDYVFLELIKIVCYF